MHFKSCLQLSIKNLMLNRCDDSFCFIAFHSVTFHSVYVIDDREVKIPTSSDEASPGSVMLFMTFPPSSAC